jgi:hypothetical protein
VDSILNKEEIMSTSTVYKVVFLNDMYFVQERNFETSADAAEFAGTITGWKVTLKVEVTGIITVVT